MSGGFSNRGPQGGGSGLTPSEILWVQSGNTGVLLLNEQGSAPSATANVGKMYVKSSDNILYYKNDLGTEFSLLGSGSVTVETPTGAVNASNQTYTVTTIPKWIVVDGTTYFEGAGYTRATLTITTDAIPSQFIRSIY